MTGTDRNPRHKTITLYFFEEVIDCKVWQSHYQLRDIIQKWKEKYSRSFNKCYYQIYTEEISEETHKDGTNKREYRMRYHKSKKQKNER